MVLENKNNEKQNPCRRVTQKTINAVTKHAIGNETFSSALERYLKETGLIK